MEATRAWSYRVLYAWLLTHIVRNLDNKVLDIRSFNQGKNVEYCSCATVVTRRIRSKVSCAVTKCQFGVVTDSFSFTWVFFYFFPFAQPSWGCYLPKSVVVISEKRQIKKWAKDVYALVYSYQICINTLAKIFWVIK